MDKDSKVLGSIYKRILLEAVKENDEEVLSYVTQPPYNFKTIESPQMIQRSLNTRVCILARRKILIPNYVESSSIFKNREVTPDSFSILKNFEKVKYDSNEYRFTGYTLDAPIPQIDEEGFMKTSYVFDDSINSSREISEWLGDYFQRLYITYNEFEDSKVKDFKDAKIDDDDIGTISGMM